MLFIKTDGASTPVGYMLRNNTTYVDDQKAPVEKVNIKVGRAVIVSYVMDGNQKVATQVLLRNAP